MKKIDYRYSEQYIPGTLALVRLLRVRKISTNEGLYEEIVKILNEEKPAINSIGLLYQNTELITIVENHVALKVRIGNEIANLKIFLV